MGGLGAEVAFWRPIPIARHTCEYGVVTGGIVHVLDDLYLVPHALRKELVMILLTSLLPATINECTVIYTSWWLLLLSASYSLLQMSFECPTDQATILGKLFIKINASLQCCYSHTVCMATSCTDCMHIHSVDRVGACLRNRSVLNSIALKHNKAIPI